MSTIICGVPQGSVLGPLFFLIYINGFHRAIRHNKVLYFADETNLHSVKGCAYYIFARVLVRLGKIFFISLRLFHSKSSSHSQENQSLNFYIFKSYSVKKHILLSNLDSKHTMLMKFDQLMS